VAQPAGPAGADCAGDDAATACGDCDPAGAADVAGAAGADDDAEEAAAGADAAEEAEEEAGADGGADDDPPDEHPATAARAAPAARTPPSLSLDETEPSMTNHPFWRAVGQRVATPSVRLPDGPRTR
jgi:hypothetical protein